MDQLYSLRHLGKISKNFSRYDAGLLETISRSDHQILPLKTRGCDQWTLYELSCKLLNGQMLTFVGDLKIPLNSPKILESKSLKLYLFGLSQRAFKTAAEYTSTLRSDLIYALNSPISLELYSPLAWQQKTQRSSKALFESVFNAKLHCHAIQNFRSKCPVTHQPDWAALFIFSETKAISSAAIDEIVRPLIDQAEFHEICITRLYAACHALNQGALITLGRFTRRGGIDINPLRSNCIDLLENIPFSLQ